MWSGGRLSLWFTVWSMIDVLEHLSLYELPPPTARDRMYDVIHKICDNTPRSKDKLWEKRV